VVDGRVFLGSIAVCVKRAKEQAVEYGHSEEREITYLICHGLLHLFGYDHMVDRDKKEMRSLEETIMNNIGIKR
jgi:probable rRNA maturation factor